MILVSSLNVESKGALRFTPAFGDVVVDERDSEREAAREAAPVLSLRDDAVNALGGLKLEGLVLDGFALDARVPCRMLVRPAVPVPVGGSIED